MSSRGVQGAPPPSGTAAPSAAPRRIATAADVRASYHQRLEEQVNRAADSFREIVSACEIRDRATNARAEFQSQVEAANLAKAADELLRLISELKIAVIVQEVKETKQESAEMRAVYEVETRQSLQELGQLRENVANSLSALEKHYYASVTKWAAKDQEQPQ